MRDRGLWGKDTSAAANKTGEPNGNASRLMTLQKRIEAAKEKMAAEQERLRAREARENERLFRSVGEICCKAAHSAEFGPALKALLESETDERTQVFLRQKGII